METKSNKEWMEKVKERCKLKHGLIVPSDGSKGGLAMLWKEDINWRLKHILRITSTHGLKVDGMEVASILQDFMVTPIQQNDRSHGPS